MANLAALDPSPDRKSISRFGKLDVEVWHDYFEVFPEFLVAPELLQRHRDAFAEKWAA